MSDDELREEFRDTRKMVYLTWVLVVLSFLFGCAPAPEAECKRDILGVEWGGDLSGNPPPAELRCLGDEPPVRERGDGLCFINNCVENGRERWCQAPAGEETCQYTVWRCPVVLADERFNK